MHDFHAALDAAERRMMARMGTLENRLEKHQAASLAAGRERTEILQRIADTSDKSDRRLAVLLRRTKIIRGKTGSSGLLQRVILWLIVANIAGALAGALGREGLVLLLKALNLPAS